MAKKSTSKKPTKKSPDFFEIRLPKILSLNAIFILVLIIFAAAIGVLTYKVFSLEKSVKETADKLTNNQAQNAPDNTPPQIVKVDAGKLPLLGKGSAKVTIVEFSDFQCPFCKSFFDDTSKQINDKYIKTGNVKFAYRQFPLTTIHPNAQISAEASECAQEQNKFWEYHDVLFQNQATWSTLSTEDVLPSLTKLAEQIGLNTDQFGTCLNNHKYTDAVNADQKAGVAAQVNGTPAFFINGYRLTGAQPFSEFQKIIEQELKK